VSLGGVDSAPRTPRLPVCYYLRLRLLSPPSRLVEGNSDFWPEMKIDLSRIHILCTDTQCEEGTMK
jgi:hypothetical protein